MITIQLTVTAAPGAPRVPLTVDPAITPTDLRKEASRVTKIPIAAIKLIVRGRLVAENDSLSAVAEYKLEEGTVLHCMGKPEEPIAATTSTGAATTNAAFSIPTVGAPSASSGPAALEAGSTDPLQAALTTLRASNSPTVYQTAVSTLDKILSNIIENPLEEKYRSLKVHNPAFQKRLGGLPGGNAAILACGFTIEKVDGEDKYCMVASAENWPALQSAKANVARAVLLANGASVPTAAGNLFAPPMGAAGLGSLPPLGMMGGMPPAASQAAAQLMSNPQMLQSMLQNPMMQSMMRNDPQIAGNPMAARFLDDLANNPEMAAQLTQMTADPRVQQMMQNPEQMQQMMAMVNQMQGANGQSPFGMPSMASAAAGGNNAGAASNAGTNGNSETDMDQTEEEMIAEAIRRSLQDGQGS